MDLSIIFIAYDTFFFFTEKENYFGFEYNVPDLLRHHAVVFFWNVI